MDFFVFATLSSLLITCILIYLFFFRKAGNKLSSKKRLQRNISLYKQHQADFVSDLNNQLITAADHQKLCTEAARHLLKTDKALSSDPVTPKKTRAFFLVFLLAPFAAYPLYLHLGASTDITIQEQLNAVKTTASAADFSAQAKKLQQSLEQRLEQRPDNLDYRLLAARFAMTKGDYAKASSHFAVIVELLPEDAEALAYLAQATFLERNKKLDNDTHNLLNKALTLNPNQPTALSILGINAFEQQNYPQAIHYWSTLLAQLPPHADQAKIIQAGIDEAKKKLTRSPSRDATALHTKAQIMVDVRLADTLNHLDKNTTVFVYAKAASGPPMPLAVEKLTVGDLPATIVLDDTTAMMPQMKLSQFERIRVGARVSLSKNPVAQKGDWQAISPVTTLKDGKVSLLINTEIR